MGRFGTMLLGLALLASPASAQEVQWLQDYHTARTQAKEKQRPLLLDFGTENCVWCKKLDATTFRDAGITKLLSERFVVMKVDGDREPRLTQALGINSFPVLVFASPEGKILGKHEGYIEVAELSQKLDRVLRESEVPGRETVPDGGKGRVSQAGQLLNLAREDYRAGEYLGCLERCRRITIVYPGSNEASEAQRLDAEIKNDPEKARQVRQALADALGEVELASAETAIRDGRMQDAATLLEHIQQAWPNSRHASAARDQLTRLRSKEPIIRAQSP